MQDQLAPYLDAVEATLRDVLECRNAWTAPLYQMMRYHMGWLDTSFVAVDAARGKRLRPVLCLLACEAVGGDWRRALPAAAALELIHNFSLIHDDIEDNSATRRHRETVWHVWGLAQGVNTGDAMWTLSRLAVYRLADEGYSAETVLAVARRLEETCLQLCSGQYMDIAFEERDDVTLVEYEAMISGKTAALLSASMGIGGLLGGARSEVVEDLAALGHTLGLAFQISDDILGIWGDPAKTGKSAASDILEAKKTAPILHALDWETERGLGDLDACFARPALTEADVPEVLRLLARAGAREYAQRQAELHQARCGELLRAMCLREPAAAMLKSVTGAIAGRTT